MTTGTAPALRMLPASTVLGMLRDEESALAALAPYNGTTPGAAAVSASRARLDAIRADLARRAALNDPNQEES